MMWSLAALVIGFGIDLLVGDPHGFPHPVVLIGKCISVLERGLRRSCPKTPAGERAAGAILWGAVVIVSTVVPAGLLWLCGLVSPWLRLALESVMCWQILAVKSLRDETMKVYDALESGDLAASRRAVSMIVGRDTDRLDDCRPRYGCAERKRRDEGGRGDGGGEHLRWCGGAAAVFSHRRRAAGLFLQGGEHHGLHAGVCGAAL